MYSSWASVVPLFLCEEKEEEREDEELRSEEMRRHQHKFAASSFLRSYSGHPEIINLTDETAGTREGDR